MKKVMLMLVVMSLLQSCYKPLQEKVINSNTCESRKFFRIEVTKIYSEYPNTTPQNVFIRTELVGKVKENYETKYPTCEFSLDFMN